MGNIIFNLILAQQWASFKKVEILRYYWKAEQYIVLGTTVFRDRLHGGKQLWETAELKSREATILNSVTVCLF